MSRRIVRNGSKVRNRGCMIESLESRVLMTAAPTAPDMNGAWYLAGMDVGGGLTLNAGNVAGGSLTFGNGSVVAGNGTYTVGAGGALTLTTTEFTSTGLVNSTADVFVVSNSTDDFPFTIAVKHTGVFDNADVAGTWNVYINGNDGSSTGNGTLVLGSAGEVKAGSSIKTTAGTKTVTGTYTINPAGDLSLNLTVTGAGTFSFTGAMNDSKNLAALGTDNLQDAVTNDDVRVAVLVKKGAGLKVSDVKGTWKMTVANGDGDVTFDGKGKITGSITTSNGPATITGTYSVSAVGLVTLKLKAILNPGVGQEVINQTLLAAINSSKNDIVGVQTPTTTGTHLSLNSMTTFTRADNYAPTLTKVSSISKAVQGVPFEIPFATLQAKANEADQDPTDVVGFVISSVDGTKGTLEINDGVNTVAVVEDVTTVFPGDTLIWTPSVVGAVPAFTVRATDNDDISDKDIAVKITSIKQPVVSIAKSGTPNELTGATGKFTVTRTGGDKTKELVVTYTIGGSAANGVDYVTLTGTVTILPNKPNAVITLTPLDADGKGGVAAKTVTLTLSDIPTTYTVSPVFAKQSASLGILQPNHPPTVDPFQTMQANLGASVPVSFTVLQGHTNPHDPEDDINITSFKIKNINGILRVNGVKRTGTVTVTVNDTVTWTNKPNAVASTVRMFDVAAFDGALASTYVAANVVLT